MNQHTTLGTHGLGHHACLEDVHWAADGLDENAKLQQGDPNGNCIHKLYGAAINTFTCFLILRIRHRGRSHSQSDFLRHFHDSVVKIPALDIVRVRCRICIRFPAI